MSNVQLAIALTFNEADQSIASIIRQISELNVVPQDQLDSLVAQFEECSEPFLLNKIRHLIINIGA